MIVAVIVILVITLFLIFKKKPEFCCSVMGKTNLEARELEPVDSWKVETTGLWVLRCVGKGTEAGWWAGRSELASHSLPGSATQAAEQSDNSPNAVMCHVTVVS